MRMNGNNRLARSVVFLLLAAAAIFAIAPYLLFDPAYSRVKLSPALSIHYPLLLVHIFTSFLALATGWIQFVPGIRAKYVHLHRLIGRIYLGCIAVGGITALVVGMYTESFIRQLAFITLALLWFITSWKGYRRIRQGRLEEHRLWMLRSYAVTLVAATARVVTPLCLLAYIASHGTPAGGVQAAIGPVLEVNIWVGLVLNLLICEWIFARRTG
ncbi:DUF2306 domain-containing protein [Paenibacillus allorhizosphaerae]|uniref:DUF2306 domain-containing protein n=1 Tax=Paenibacillus allorhizosphaerae TaxID=2849866 RepID=A0ABN7TGC1_9BACL|nr:DUF2306 domain-containing protein [Paenibacillus allorhizosphaerae]CAG7617666.1 hypothetical protein PAECIP111802_00434 [Paenibacillus allorhizosphaerae]